jgi:uncharacterized protein
MKYLLVLAVVFVAIWIWRKNRREEMKSRPPPPAPPPAVGAPQAMVRCAYCGLHLPAADAITGPSGVYCSTAHRQADGR